MTLDRIGRNKWAEGCRPLFYGFERWVSGAALGCYHRDARPVVSHQATNAKLKKAHLMVSLF
jgi:hypothetical protein